MARRRSKQSVKRAALDIGLITATPLIAKGVLVVLLAVLALFAWGLMRALGLTG
jgi:hypothetical protein